MVTAGPPTPTVQPSPAGRYRWVVVALLFTAMVFNYLDRQTIAVLKPTLQHEFGWSELTYADIVFWFQAAYAVGYLSFGVVVDRIGAKAGYVVAFSIWTVAHLMHGFVRSASGFVLARMALGVGESGSFPAGLKAVADWFPKQERALATGVWNAGTNIGAVVTPLVVPAITLAFGWRWAFIVTGLASLVWLAAWLLVYRRPEQEKRLGAAELAYIRSDGPDTGGRIGWFAVFAHRETWAYALGRFLIDPVWWLLLFWLPDFLARRYGLDLKSFGPPLVAVYILSDLGSVGGGWLSSQLLSRGVALNRARKLTLLLCALAVTPIAFAANVHGLWAAVGIIGLAAAGHQAFSANLYSFPGDVFPRAAVGAVVGVGGLAGTVGGMVMSKYAGWVLQRTGHYTLIFIAAAGAYLLALLVIQLLCPRYAPVRARGAAPFAPAV